MKNIFRFLFVVFCLFTTTNPLHAQWIQTSGPPGGWVRSFAVSGANLFAGITNGGVFLSTNNGTSWTAASAGLPSTSTVDALTASGTYLFAGTNGIFLSTDNGTSWTAANTGFTGASVATLAVSGTNLFAGANGGGVFLSTNNGANWTAKNVGLTNTIVNAFCVSSTNLFAGTAGGVFLSTDDGTSWTAASTGLTNTWINALAVSGTNLFAGTTNGGVFLSTNNGTSWTAASTGLTNTIVYALAVSGTNLFAGTHGEGVFLSTDNGTSWTAASTGLTNTYVYSLAVSGTNLFAGTFGAGVFVAVQSSLPVEITNFIAEKKLSAVELRWTTATEVNNYGFEVERRIIGETSSRWNTIGFVAGAGTSNSPHQYSYNDNNLPSGKFAYRLKQIDRDGSFQYYGNAEVEMTAPAEFFLGPNFPNPFNPATTFSFSLPLKSLASLKVFDALGREVSVVFSEELLAGKYSRQWNAADLPSGMYFYRLQAGSFTQTKKLILLK